MSQKVIGLDIGHYSVKVLRLNASYKGFVAESFDEEVLDTVVALPDALLVPEGEDTADGEGLSSEELQDAIHDAEDAAIHQALEELRQRGALPEQPAAMVVSLPPDLIISGRMSFPFTDPRQLGPVIPAEFEDMIPVDIDDLMLDHHLVGPSNQDPEQNDILVSGVKREDLEVFLDLWQNGGIDPQKVVMGDASLLNLGSYLLSDMNEPYAIIDLGHRFTKVVCLEPEVNPEDGALSGKAALGYARSFKFGGHNLTAAIEDVMGCSYAQAEAYKHRQGELTMQTAIAGIDDIRASDAMKRSLRALIRELRRTFQAHFDERRTHVTRLFICGGTSRLRNLAPWLAEELSVPVEPLPVASDELASLQLSTGQPATAAQSLALALNDAMPRNLERIGLNFRSGPYAHKGAQGWFREKVVGLVVLVALLLCSIGAMLGSNYYAISQEEEALKASLEKTSKRLFGEAKAPDAVKKELQSLGSSVSIIPSKSAYDYFFEASKRVPEGEDIEFTNLEVDLFRQLVKIQATAVNATVVDAYVESLETFECFKGKVTKGSTESMGERVRFDLSIAPECPGARKKDDKKK